LEESATLARAASKETQAMAKRRKSKAHLGFISEFGFAPALFLCIKHSELVTKLSCEPGRFVKRELLVAQIFNLLYRLPAPRLRQAGRFAIGGAAKSAVSTGSGQALQNSILRYGRLQIGATTAPGPKIEVDAKRS
jgi:hypothetical protein